MNTRRDAVVDTYHGYRVADPYRWMEDAKQPEVQEWIALQNERTETYVAGEAREALRKRLTSIWNYDRYGVPKVAGGRYFYWHQSGLANQPVYCMQEGIDAEPVVVIDPNALKDDGTAALSGIACSPDGKFIAYAISESGSDWQVIHVYDVDRREALPEMLSWCKFTSIAWRHDGSGFFYTRFPAVDEASRYEGLNRNHGVYYHALGTAQEEDPLVYERPDAPDFMFSVETSEDGVYIYLVVTEGTDPKTRVYIRKTASDEPFLRLLDDYDAMYAPVAQIGSVLYLHTDLRAPRGRLIAIDLMRPSPADWVEIVPETDDVIEGVEFAGGQFVVLYLHHAHHQVRIFSQGGVAAGEIALPTIGSVNGISGEPASDELFFGFTSFLYPSQVYRYDLSLRTASVWRSADVPFDLAQFETTQVFCTSKDGTQVPMFLTHKKGLPLDGSNPALLYGYGGFSVSLPPWFSVSTVAWLEQGGVYALANLRGGNEYGEEWHQAGMLFNKQNVFDDFIASAEWLVQAGYTRPDRLAIMGGSNGGLLVAACMLQRPDLYGAVVCQVPVTDMLRYHKFTAGRFWVSEYGNAEESRALFETVFAYSPLHNVRHNVVYPPILITTADTDDRVVPMHSFKFAATLQEAATADASPILLRVETSAGHGAGKPTAKVIGELADEYAFMRKALRMD